MQKLKTITHVDQGRLFFFLLWAIPSPGYCISMPQYPVSSSAVSSRKYQKLISTEWALIRAEYISWFKQCWGITAYTSICRHQSFPPESWGLHLYLTLLICRRSRSVYTIQSIRTSNMSSWSQYITEPVIVYYQKAHRSWPPLWAQSHHTQDACFELMLGILLKWLYPLCYIMLWIHVIIHVLHWSSP